MNWLFFATALALVWGHPGDVFAHMDTQVWGREGGVVANTQVGAYECKKETCDKLCSGDLQPQVKPVTTYVPPATTTYVPPTTTTFVAPTTTFTSSVSRGFGPAPPAYAYAWDVEATADEHGCLTGVDEEWCEVLQRCVYPWVTPCVAAQPVTFGQTFTSTFKPVIYQQTTPGYTIPSTFEPARPIVDPAPVLGSSCKCTCSAPPVQPVVRPVVEPEPIILDGTPQPIILPQPIMPQPIILDGSPPVLPVEECDSSWGFVWCEPKMRCIQPWNERCVSCPYMETCFFECPFGYKEDSNGCDTCKCKKAPWDKEKKPCG